MGKIISLLSVIQPAGSPFVNSLIQSVVFEIIMFVSIPLLGIAIDSIIVRGIRKVGVRLLGPKIENVFANYILLAGVVIHELSHAFFALITGARIDEIALFKPEGNSLGHVNFTPRGDKFLRALQLSLSACAPVVTGMIITFTIATRFFPTINGVLQYVIGVYLFISVLFHMNMSSADLKCYFRGALPILVLGLPICIFFVF